MSDPNTNASPHIRRRKLVNEEPAPASTDPGLDVEAAFESVQEVMGKLSETVDEIEAEQAYPEAKKEQDSETQDTILPAEVDAGDALADELQAMLDADAAFQSPEELLGEEQEEDEPAAPIASEPEPEADADPPSIGDVDAMLAEDGDDALQGDFESIDTLLNNAEAEAATPEADEEIQEVAATAADHDQVDDELAGAFETVAEATGEPADETAETPPAVEAAEAVEVDDEVGGTFESIDEMNGVAAEEADPEDVLEGGTFESIDEPEDVIADGSFEAVEEDADDVLDGSFEAIEEEPEPAKESVFEADADEPDAVMAEAEPEQDEEARTFTLTLPRLNLAGLNIRKLVPLLRRVNDVLLWLCAIINFPMKSVSDDIRKSVGWAAIAVVAPGFLLVLYGLLLA